KIMRYRSKDYARALALALKERGATEQGKIVKRFIAMVNRFGDGGNLPRIIEEYERQETSDRGGRSVTLEFAREAKGGTVEELMRHFKKEDRVTLKLNPALFAGVRITLDGEKELDLSLAGRLGRMFKN
ncbi:MAG: F0F1 ATP synthase subunit delta, partial [Candidatus Vogelbacteria bacterium]|nr:F0F1 ATP synthase subunit delta [Candidatus Vogelbacteria bacterium]